MGRYKRLPENYFKFVNPIIISFLGVGMYLLVMSWLDPKSISTTYFGRIGELFAWAGVEYRHIMKQVLLCLLALHIVTAMVGVYLCQKRRLGSLITIAWTLQNLLLGFLSLHYLIWPQKMKKSNHNNNKKDDSSKKNSNKSKDSKSSKNSNKGKETNKAKETNKSPKSKDKNNAKSRKDK